jgi:hypothetical protein
MIGSASIALTAMRDPGRTPFKHGAPTADLKVIDAKGLEVAAPSFIDQESRAAPHLAKLDDHSEDESEPEVSRY